MSAPVLPAKTTIRSHEFDSTIWLVDLDRVTSPVSFEDVMAPEFWQHHAGGAKIKRGDLIRVLGQGRSFDVMLTATDVFAGGISVATWPLFPSRAAP